MEEITKYYYNYSEIGHQIYPLYTGTVIVPYMELFFMQSSGTAEYKSTLFYTNKSVLDRLVDLLTHRWIDSPNCYLLALDHELTDEDKKAWHDKMLGRIYSTMTLYVDRINKYDELAKKTLPTSLTSSSESRFNDTPTEEGNYSADNFTTNITQNKTSTDIDPVDRYNQLKALIEDIYAEWIGRLVKGVEIWIN